MNAIWKRNDLSIQTLRKKVCLTIVIIRINWDYRKVMQFIQHWAVFQLIVDIFLICYIWNMRNPLRLSAVWEPLMWAQHQTWLRRLPMSRHTQSWSSLTINELSLEVLLRLIQNSHARCYSHDDRIQKSKQLFSNIKQWGIKHTINIDFYDLFHASYMSI